MPRKICWKCCCRLKDRRDTMKSKLTMNWVRSPSNPFLGNRKYYSVHPKWEFSHIMLPVKNLRQLNVHFNDILRPKIANWTSQCKKILQKKHSPLCQYVLKKGQTPRPLRGELWAYVLGSNSYVCNTAHCYPFDIEIDFFRSSRIWSIGKN